MDFWGGLEFEYKSKDLRQVACQSYIYLLYMHMHSKVAKTYLLFSYTSKINGVHKNELLTSIATYHCNAGLAYIYIIIEVGPLKHVSQNWAI